MSPDIPVGSAVKIRLFVGQLRAIMAQERIIWEEKGLLRAVVVPIIVQ